MVKRRDLFMLIFLLAVFAGLAPSTSKAQVFRGVGWTTGQGSETQFKRIREGTPSTCAIQQSRGTWNSGEGRRETLLLMVDCRRSPTGGKIVFDSFIGARLQPQWQVAEVRTRQSGSTSGVRVELLRLPQFGGTSLETRARLVAQRGKVVSVVVDIIGFHPSPATLPDVMWCEQNGFRCERNTQCDSGYTCSQSCGGVCVRPN